MAFPDFRIRGGGEVDGKHWLHVGTDDTYIALNESSDISSALGTLNHLGFVVQDVDALAERMREAGYREGASELAHPHRKRRYFFDTEDTEWEFVEYFSDDPAQRNDYSV